MKEDVFMALPVSGGIYTFQCLGAEDMFLNLYYYNGISNGQNVILWDGDGSKEQQWKFDGKKLLTVRNTSFALDKYTVAGNPNNNNADVWEANDPTNQNIVFESTSSGSNVVRIKLASSNMYLTAYGFQHGTNDGKTPTSKGNVFWASKTTSTMQQWIFTKVGGSVDPEPGNGQKLVLPIDATTLTASYKNAAYANTYNCTHFGIDMVSSSGISTIHASGQGTLIAKGWDENAGYVVVIKYPNAYHHTTGKYEDIIFRYYHLKSINSNIPTKENAISKNTVIGNYGGSGMGKMDRWNPHLHVEADTDTSYPCYSPTFSSNGSIIKVGTSSTCHSALEYLHRMSNQTYRTTNDAYINNGDNSIPAY